ncbi:MAG: 7TM diverse intracellular signaling domain-containing protein [Oligoflexus sp.]
MDILRFALVFLALVKSGVLLSVPQNYHLADDDHYPIERMQIYTTEDSELEIADINSLDAWKVLHKLDFNFGLSKSVYWFKFELFNDSQIHRQWILELGYPSLDYISVFIDNGNETVEKYSGDMLEFSKREVSLRKNTFTLDFEPQQAVTAYIKIQTESSIQGPITLWKPRAFAEKIADENMGYGLYIGIMVAMIVYNFFLYLNIRDRSQFYYIAYIGSYTYSFLAISGYAGQYLTPDWYHFSNIMTPITIGISGVFVVIFSAEFLNLRSISKFSFRVCQALMVWGALAAVSSFYSYHFAIKLAASFSVIGALLLFVVGLFVLTKDYKNALFYVLAFAALLLGVAIKNLTTFGVFNPNFFTQNSIHFGSAIQVMLLSIAIGDKFKRQQAEAKENIHRLNEALRVEHEKVTSLNTHLEAKVDEQTRDIRSMFDHITLGVFTIKKDETIGSRYSKHLENILESTNISGQFYGDLLFSNSECSEEDISKTKSAIASALGEPYFTYAVNEKCLIQEFGHKMPNGNIKFLEINWIPILDRNENIDRILVTLKDVTKLRELEKFSSQKKKDLEFIAELIQVGKERYKRFVSTSEKLLEENQRLISASTRANQEALKIIFINLHTLKGIARSLNFKKLSELVHNAEEFVGTIQRDLANWNINRIQIDHNEINELLRYYIYINDSVLERSVESNVIEVKTEQISHFMENLSKIKRLKNDKEVEDFIAKIDDLFSKSYYLSAQGLFEDIFAAKVRLAKDLNKIDPNVTMSNIGFEFTPDGCELLRNVFIHLIRNSMDHGIESPQERINSGKSEAGQLFLELNEVNDNLELVFWDDGRGLAIRTIKELLHVQGYLTEKDFITDQLISDFIFKPGFSTSHITTEISGRGMGMSAIRTYIEGEGGKISIILGDEDVSSQDLYRQFKVSIRLPRRLYREIETRQDPQKAA